MLCLIEMYESEIQNILIIHYSFYNTPKKYN